MDALKTQKRNVCNFRKAYCGKNGCVIILRFLIKMMKG